MVDEKPTTFAPQILAAFRDAIEVEIETRDPAIGARRTIIWIVVADGAPYVRSVRGPAARWYRLVREQPECAIHVAGHRVPVKAVLADDAATAAAVSSALAIKYADDPSTPAMLMRNVLGTTLRLEPA